MALEMQPICIEYGLKNFLRHISSCIGARHAHLCHEYGLETWL